MLSVAILLSNATVFGTTNVSAIGGIGGIGITDVLSGGSLVVSSFTQGVRNASRGTDGRSQILRFVDGVFGTHFATPYYTMEDVYNAISAVDSKITDMDKRVTTKLNILTDMTSEMNDTMITSFNRVQQSLSEISQDVEELADNMEDNALSTTSQIGSMEASLKSLIGSQTQDIKISLYNSTLEMEGYTTLLTNMDNYYDRFDGLYSVENGLISDLNNLQSLYGEFIDAINAQENGYEIMDILSEFTLNYDESYGKLSDEEKALLNTSIMIGTTNTTVNNYYVSYISAFDQKMSEIYEKNDGYISNICEASNYLKEYIMGETTGQSNVGICENYYKLAMLSNSNSEEVHQSYLSFRNSVLVDYYKTVYLATLACNYKLAYEQANDPTDSVAIDDYKNKLNSLSAQAAQVMAYSNYEYEKCIRQYDFNNYVNDDLETYICYYGNAKNAANGIDRWTCKTKAEIMTDGGLSNSYVILAIGEEKPLNAYIAGNDITSDVVWTSSNEDAVIVDDDGRITGAGSGNAVITASYGENTWSCTVSVSNNIAIRNGTDTSRYYYDNDSYYEIVDNIGYDYYFNKDVYTTTAATLDDECTSVSLEELTSLSGEELSEFAWSTSNSNVAEYIGSSIFKVDGGTCVIVGRMTDSDTIIVVPIKVFLSSKIVTLSPKIKPSVSAKV